MVLTIDQRTRVLKQLLNHKRDSGSREVILGENKSIKLYIEQGVFGSDIMSSAIYLARFLYHNKKLYFEKDVLDMGCGPGTQGMVMLEYGAKSAVLADINPKAVLNTKINLKEKSIFNAEAYESDLFANLAKNKTYEVIVFNHPFFPANPAQFEGDPNEDEMLRRSMLGGTELIKRFFREVSNYLRQDGLIIMPYFQPAGVENDPIRHVDEYGFKVSKKELIESKEGLQIGKVFIYLIVRK